MKRRQPMIVLYARHYCSKCDLRVFPYDSFERKTEAPKRGVSGRRVLLFSSNSRHREDDQSRTAWCWNCSRWVTTYRETIDMIEKRYAERDGVVMRKAPRQLSQSRRSGGSTSGARRNNILPLKRRSA
ncbi:MAG: hypothetical protein ACHQ0J_13525 [Candidatus Dormibacterales bacterium]